MSNEINALQKFFEYLTQNGKNADNVVDEADANGDTYLTKGEFKKYIDGIGLNLTADEVSQVYKSLDTNTKGKISGTKLNNRNALDSNEVSAMQAKLEAYQEVRGALDDVFGSGYESVTIPTELKPYVSRASVEESVMANMNSNFQVNNLEELLAQAIAKAGGNGYGQAKFAEVLNTAHAQGIVPASYNGDDEFQSLLSAYIKTLGADTDLSGIISDVDAIVETYFASAGIGSADSAVTDSDGDLHAFGWDDAQGLNPLQLAVLAGKISNAINIDTETYNKFKSEFDAAIQGFISETCASGSFADINTQLNGMNITQAFNSSKYGKALEVLITLSDFSEPGNGTSQLNNAFYNVLKDTLGNDFAQALASADVNYVAEKGLYNTVLRTVYQMVLSGEIANDDDTIINKMIELIIENYAEFKSGLGIGSSNGDVDGLYENVDTLVDKGGALAAVRTAAIAYLDAVSSLGSEKLNSFINATFDGDYKTTIENLMSQSVIGSKIDAVKEKYDSMISSGEIVLKVEPSSCTATWNDVTVPTLKTGGSAQSFSCTATINDPNGKTLPNSLTNPITYGIVTVGGNTGSKATINPDTGEITLTPGAQDGTAIIKVKVMVNGVEIGTKEISVTVAKPVFDKSRAGIEHGGIKIPVDGSDLGWVTSRDNAIKNFSTNIVAKLKAAAIEQGFDATKAENAAKTLESYFSAAMTAFTYFNNDKSLTWFDKSPHREEKVTFSYRNYATDQDVSVSSGIGIRASLNKSYVNDYTDLSVGGDDKGHSGTGIYIGCDTTGTADDFWVFVNGKKMIDLFVSFLG